MEIAFYGFFVVVAAVIGFTLWNIDRERNKRARERQEALENGDWFDTPEGHAALMSWEEQLLDSPKE
jgi:preprotein translocase subunit YajC